MRTTTGAVAGESTAAAEAPAALPFTGASIAALVAAATLALIAGGALLLAVRRRRT
ncbi:MAG TPA: LPXTG cell wall anchor domain-containing protein [Gaiellales bacterium]|nr:LPXTG cell wall anchor domain-containing protein [Gaiellales bacterium]